MEDVDAETQGDATAAQGAGLSLRQIARSLSVAYGTVHGVMRRAEAAALAWPLPEEVDEVALKRPLYPGNQDRPRRRPEPDWPGIDAELRRKGVEVQRNQATRQIQVRGVRYA